MEWDAVQVEGNLVFEPDGTRRLTDLHHDGRPVRAERVNNRESALYADLLSIEYDLFQVQVTAAELMTNTALPSMIVSAAWEGILIAYRRCFQDGKSLAGRGVSRAKLHDQIKHLPPELREVHARVLNVADKHVAHRVLPEKEQADIDVLVYDDGTNEMCGVTPGMIGRIVLEKDLLGQIPALAGALHALLDSEKREQGRRVYHSVSRQSPTEPDEAHEPEC